MDIHSSSGTIRAGQYGLLDLTGHHELEPGVRFHTLRAQGCVTMQSCRGRTVICAGGHLRCSGTMDVEELSGFGHVDVRRELHAGTVRFTGGIATELDVRCRNDLEIIGFLHSPTQVTAQTLLMRGALRTRKVHGEQVVIQSLQTMLYTQRYMTEYHNDSTVHAITATTADLQGVVCHVVEAHHVVLHERCIIDLVRYRNTYRFHRHCRVHSLNWTGSGQATRYQRA